MQDFSIYIHYPWCIKKCPYCDFNSHVAKSIPFEEYTQKIISDFYNNLHLLADRKLASIFIGGGTPSLFPPKYIQKILKEINKNFSLNNIEITIEANPGSLDNDHLIGYSDIGINRLSIGVQSFNNQLLLNIGRVHDKKQAEDAIEKALNLFKRINIDLMFALPNQSTEQAIDDLIKACSYPIEHLSWYQLTIEPGTHFEKKPPKLPESHTIDDIYDSGINYLREHGFNQYEISAYTRDKVSAHNRNYWLNGDYIGIGAGSHSKLSYNNCIHRWSQHRSPKKYLTEIQSEWSQSYIPSEHIYEYFLNRTRMSGFSSWHEIELYSMLTKDIIINYLNQKKLNEFIQISDQGLIFTPKSMLFNRYLMQELLDCNI